MSKGNLSIKSVKEDYKYFHQNRLQIQYFTIKIDLYLNKIKSKPRLQKNIQIFYHFK